MDEEDGEGIFTEDHESSCLSKEETRTTSGWTMEVAEGVTLEDSFLRRTSPEASVETIQINDR